MFNFNIDSEQLYFNLRINWPKWIPWFTNTFTWYKSWRVSENKSTEIQIECDWDCLFELSFNLTRCTDHAGAMLMVGFLKHWIMLGFNDNRHWNHDENRYYNDSDHDKMYFTREEAEAKITSIAQTIKGGIKDTELDKMIKELPGDEWAIAVIGKLAEWQYSTEANRMAKKIWNEALLNAWWVSKSPGTPKEK